MFFYATIEVTRDAYLSGISKTLGVPDNNDTRSHDPREHGPEFCMKNGSKQTEMSSNFSKQIYGN